MVKKDSSLRLLLNKEMEGRRGSTADFALRFKDGSIRWCLDKPCHAELRWFRDEGEKEEITDIALFMKFWHSQVPDEWSGMYMKYVQWILKDSPWACCFKTKTASIAIEKGVTMNVDRNVSELLGAAIALREGWEYQNRLPMLQYCLDKGASLPVAYLMGQAINKNRDGSFSRNSMQGGHSAIHGDMDFDALMSFFREGYATGLKGIRNDPTQNTYKVFDTITSRAAKPYYETKDTDKFSTKLFAVTQPKITGEGWGKIERYSEHDIDNMISLLESELKKGKK